MIPQFDPIWAWPWVILAAGVSLVVVVTTYGQRIAHLPPAQRNWLLALRLLTWAILTLAMLRPWLEFTEVDRHASVFVVVADESRSMGVKDGPAGATRRETVLKMLDEVHNDLDGLGQEIKIERVNFAKDVSLVDEFSPETPGDQTAIGHLLDRIPKLFPDKKIVGVLLFSDGAQRALSPFDADPRSAANRLAEQQIRVDTVGIGTSGISDSALDLIAEDLEVSPTVFVKNVVVVGAKIRAFGAADQELTVRLLLEDPTTAEGGNSGKMRAVAPPLKIKPKRSEEVIPVELNFVAQDPGEFKLMLEVVPLEGEPQTTNNSLTTFISVLKGGVSVAYFDREHRAEMKFLKRIDESPDIRLVAKAIRTAPGDDRPHIELDWFEPGKFDVYIIGSVRANTFPPEGLKKLAREVEQGAGLLMLGGTNSFGPGGYARTPLADLLPVVTLPTEIQNGDDPDPTLHYEQPLQMIPTSQGLSHFVMRLDSGDKNLAAWKSLPPLNGANKFRALKDGALVLAEAAGARGAIPLLVAEDYGRGRTMAFAGDSTWLWYLAGQHEAHQRFWQQAVLWLAHKDIQGDESVWVKLDSRRLRVGQALGMALGARDPEKRPIDDATFKIEVTDPDGKKHSLTPQRTEAENRSRFLETRRPGDYLVHVEASKDGQPIGTGAEARFIIYDQDLELHNPAADFALLEEISKITGGMAVPPGELDAHLKRLSRLGLNVEVTRVRRILLWDNWPVFAIFVLAISLEWFFRKRHGLV
ncbi:MAG TPA: glutamine amidotransferase [Planctomycetaceae bacterium]|nr:glutamine amidotransferase [Planctomycetaceae bacterium]